ncbi:MAG: hypothetical protein ACRDQA_14270, partial [Nocardioidaceae bacterium]
ASHFAKVCGADSGWNVIHLDCLRSPNITYDRVVGEDPSEPKFPLLASLMEAEGLPYSTEEVSDDLRLLLVNEQWIEERIARWASVSVAQAEHTTQTFGIEAAREKIRSATAGSPLFTAKVRGLFSEAASDGVIPLGWVQRAVERWHDLRDGKGHPNDPGNFVLGVDVARTGDDETCFAHRNGSHVFRLDHFHLTDTMEVADRAAAVLHEPRSSAVVDVIGIGAGVYDLLRRYKREGVIVGTAIPFNAAARTPRKDKLGQFKFLNDRAAAWWGLRELLDPAFGSNIALPDDESLIEELIAPKFDFNVGGTLKIESKEDIKRRIGRSTDSADAVIAAFWMPGTYTQQEAFPYSQTETRGRFYNYEQSEESTLYG